MNSESYGNILSPNLNRMKDWSFVSYLSFNVKPNVLSLQQIKELVSLFHYFWRGVYRHVYKVNAVTIDVVALQCWRCTSAFIACCEQKHFPLLLPKDRLINAVDLPRRAFLNFIRFTVSNNQPTDGERVCALQSWIGPFWSHALFLIPLRTCYIAFSPHTASDQSEITA